MLAFKGNTVQQLQQWLEQHGVDTSCYGTGLSKTVMDLLEESQKNESVLDVEEGRALRIVRVLSLYIINPEGQILFEEEQILPDGRSRCRNVALSEKLVGEEHWRDAIGRAIQEELGTVLPESYEVTINDQSHQVFNLVSTSMSFPNLPTKYIFHRVSANCTGLPDEPFTTYEERPFGRLVTKWVWRFESEMPSDICASTG